MSVWGMPGLGGSFGKCAVCGGDFGAGVIKGLAGLPSGIQEFQVGFVDQLLFAHDPDCVEKIKAAFTSDDAGVVKSKLPDGPLKNCLIEALQARQKQMEPA